MLLEKPNEHRFEDSYRAAFSSKRAVLCVEGDRMVEADPRIAVIVKAVAVGELAEQAGAEYCPYACGHSPYDRAYNVLDIDMIHAPDCPITLARSLMADWGTPLAIYKIVYQRWQKGGAGWHDLTAYRVGYSSEEVAGEWAASDDRTRYRDVTVEFERLFPWESNGEPPAEPPA
jgi:hypothetical protein